MLRSPLSSPLRSPLSSPLAARRGGGAGAYNPIHVFGSDLVTWYGNSVDDLWAEHRACWEDSPELVVNGSLWAGAGGASVPTGASKQGWFQTSTGTYAVSEAGITITNGPEGRTGFYFTVPVTPGEAYVLRWEGLSGADPQIRVTSTIDSNSVTPLRVVISEANGAGGAVVNAGAGSVLYVSFSNYSTVAGTTATLRSLSFRRLLVDNPRLFTDNIGTTPITALEQTVGLILDKSKGLELGPDLVVNGSFDTDTSGWALLQPTVTAMEVVDGRLWFRNTSGVATSNSTVTQTFPTVANRWYQVTGDVEAITSICRVQVGTYRQEVPTGGVRRVNFMFLAAGPTSSVNLDLASIVAWSTGSAYFDNISVRELPGHHLSQATATARGRLSARYNQLLATATLSTQSITTIAASQRLTFSGAGSITLSGTATGTYSAGTHTITTTAGTLTLTVSGSVTNADLRLSAYPSSWPSYQRVTTASDYDAVGFPARLLTDGVDDRWVTGVLSLSGTLELSGFAAVTVRGSSGSGRVWSSSTTSDYVMYAPRGGSRLFVHGSGGFADTLNTAYGSGFTGVLAGLTKRDVLRNTLRANGVQLAENVAAPVAGGHPDFALGVGGATNGEECFNGDIFSLPMIVRRLATPEEITAAEKAFGKTIGVLQ
jgi:hypothetical protein